MNTQDRTDFTPSFTEQQDQSSETTAIDSSSEQIWLDVSQYLDQFKLTKTTFDERLHLFNQLLDQIDQRIFSQPCQL